MNTFTQINMKRIGTPLVALFLGICFASHCEATVYYSAPPAEASSLLFSQLNDGQSIVGSSSGAGQITSLTETTLPRSGYLEINGSNLGSGGTVLVDGVSALVANWQSTKIVCYVPESTQLVVVPVQVVNDSDLPSNTVTLTVTARQATMRTNQNLPQQYATADDGTPLHWLPVIPTGSGKHPAVILFPGGQFRRLDAIPDAVSKSLAAAGYMVFNMTEYRTAPPNKLAGQVSLGRWPDQTNDVELAAAAAKIDSRCNGEVFVVGGSAGASHGAYLIAEGLIKAAVAISPPMQLDDPVSLQDPAFRNDVNNYAPNQLAEASPNALFTSGQPPIFVIAFAQDHIPTPQYTIACSHLGALKASYVDLLLPGAGHSWDAWRVSGVPAQVIAFLNAHRSF